jgi:hypothetical protein
MTAAPQSAPPPDTPKPRSYFGVFQFVILTSNVCSSSPFSFRFVFFAAFFMSYLIRIVRPELASFFNSTPVFLVIYYLCIGWYRLLIYNRKLDPLLAVPGPTGHWVTGLNKVILENEVRALTPLFP